METYVGLDHDINGGMTRLGRIVMDGRVFDFIPESQDCAGWGAAQMQVLYEKVYAAWEPYGHLPGQLPPELREKHARIYAAAMVAGRAKGWDPELGEDE